MSERRFHPAVAVTSSSGSNSHYVHLKALCESCTRFQINGQKDSSLVKKQIMRGKKSRTTVLELIHLC
jgi:hypothetical protein